MVAGHKTKSDPQTNGRVPTSKRFTNSEIRDEPVLLSIAIAPFRAARRSYRFLSGIKGFGVVASIMTVYCAGLSIEAVYVATPVATSFVFGEEYTEEHKAARRFIPKPYVNDGADFGRLFPFANFQRAILQDYFQWLPMWVRGRVESPYWTIWNEPGVLFVSVVFAVTIQFFESKIWRKKDLAELKEQFNEANSVKNVTPDEDAIAVAAVKAAEHNSYGMGSVLGTGFAILLLYGMELGAFIGSFFGAGNFAISMVYGFLTIFGFELFDRLDDDVQK